MGGDGDGFGIEVRGASWGALGCWACGSGSWKRRSNRTRVLVIYRDGSVGLLCRRHGAMVDTADGVVVDLGSLKRLHLRKRR